VFHLLGVKLGCAVKVEKCFYLKGMEAFECRFGDHSAHYIELSEESTTVLEERHDPSSYVELQKGSGGAHRAGRCLTAGVG
jgi:hypothetical protein